MKYKGKAHKFGDNINTDDIIPAKYLNIHDAVELGKFCMEHVDKNFAKKVKKGDIIVGGKNFGCGSSREHAPIAIKGCGVSCVIAETFARIFYRNAINIGLPVVTSSEAAKGVKEGNAVEVDTHKGVIKNISKKKEYKTEAYPPFLEKIIKKGGLLNAIKR
ncbi:MAG: 3-isopropylmalate dehydratase small subunit [Candidatus Omnitrophica bacterium]|nr:3-isopropylmalate dehydratase small subunit [Candidatus Omnitrophota bacterium]